MLCHSWRTSWKWWPYWWKNSSILNHVKGRGIYQKKNTMIVFWYNSFGEKRSKLWTLGKVSEKVSESVSEPLGMILKVSENSRGNTVPKLNIFGEIRFRNSIFSGKYGSETQYFRGNIKKVWKNRFWGSNLSGKVSFETPKVSTIFCRWLWKSYSKPSLLILDCHFYTILIEEL